MDLKEVKFLFTHSSIYGMGTIVTQLVAFSMLPIYTRYLTPQDYGILELIDTTNMLIGLFVGLGFSRGMARLYYEEDTVSYKSKVVSTAYLNMIALSLVTLPALFAGSPFLAHILFESDSYSSYFQISFVSLVLGLLVDIGLMALRLEKKPFQYISITITRLLMLVAMNIIFVVYFEMAVFGILLSTLINRIAYALFMMASIFWRTKITFSKSLSLDMLKFCLPLVPASLFSTLIKQSDKYFIRYFLSLSDAGIYSLALKMGNAIHYFITIPFITAYIPRRFELVKKPNAKDLFRQVFTYYSFFFVLAGLSISILVPEILRILVSEQFYDAEKYIPLIILSMYVFGCQYHFDFGIEYAKQTKFFAYINFAVAVTHIILNFFLISRLGIYGAVLASILVLGLQALLYLAVSRHFYNIAYEFPRVIAFLAAAVAVYFLSGAISFASLFVAIGFKLLLIGLFFCTAVLLGIISKEETYALKNLVSKVPLMNGILKVKAGSFVK